LCGCAETIPGRYRVTMMGRSPGRPGWRAGTWDETGIYYAVKGEIDASEHPPEARVPR